MKHSKIFYIVLVFSLLVLIISGIYLAYLLGKKDGINQAYEEFSSLHFGENISFEK